ncbi:hypothetical protein [Jeongeupia sp. USM3]|uniref:DUF6941 family protein n=1 Tax=Jeongeupia sp. USM3 TaxID=1906741 RepID=UPI00089DE681|nr:hypothetical protein [Jeongeupia sp. USM3]AOY00121.1 hypothetical protein BJP62_06445 [Jeongeupia sp. USM3]
MVDRLQSHSIFCDDIRHEVNGKTTLVGCYAGVMYVQAFPALLARLCILNQVVIPLASEAKGTVSITIMKEDETLARTEMQVTEIFKAAQDNPATPEESTFAEMQSATEFSPLAIEKPCLLQVITATDDGIIGRSRLRILQMPTAPAGAQ